MPLSLHEDKAEKSSERGRNVVHLESCNQDAVRCVFGSLFLRRASCADPSSRNAMGIQMHHPETLLAYRFQVVHEVRENKFAVAVQQEDFPG